MTKRCAPIWKPLHCLRLQNSASRSNCSNAANQVLCWHGPMFHRIRRDRSWIVILELATDLACAGSTFGTLKSSNAALKVPPLSLRTTFFRRMRRIKDVKMWKSAGSVFQFPILLLDVGSMAKKGFLFLNPSYRICSHNGQVVNKKGVNIKWLRLWDWRLKCRNSSWEWLSSHSMMPHDATMAKTSNHNGPQSSWVDSWWFIVGILSQMQFLCSFQEPSGELCPTDATRSIRLSACAMASAWQDEVMMLCKGLPGRPKVANWKKCRRWKRSGMVLPNWNHLSKYLIDSNSTPLAHGLSKDLLLYPLHECCRFQDVLPFKEMWRKGETMEA